MDNPVTGRPASEEPLRPEYNRIAPLLLRLGSNVQQAIIGFLEEHGISVLTVDFRVKSFESFAEKIKRKGYTNPLSQCEDLSGVRIICYYASDVPRISNILASEFVVHETRDKTGELGVQEFGYRSEHLVVSVPEAWLVAPNYRGLRGHRTEIQIRTVLMHAWAEIQHKLAYKSEEQIPDLFRRKFSRLSASFEEADERFEELRLGLADYRRSLREHAVSAGTFQSSAELNLDSLLVFLDYVFPDRGKLNNETALELLEELRRFGYEMKDLTGAVQKTAPHLAAFEREVSPADGTAQDLRLGKAGLLRAVLDICYPNYARSRAFSMFTGEDELSKRWKVAAARVAERISLPNDQPLK